MSFLDADYSSIEARIVCWLAGQEDALDEYRQGVDRYKRMASFIYGIPEEEVNKYPQRFLGKTAILLCGFQGGPAKFRESCSKMGYDLPRKMEFKAVETYRTRHKKVEQGWKDVDKAAKNAIAKKGTKFHACRCDFLVRDVEAMPFLLIRLPSGRKLAYPKPKIIPSRKFKNATSVAYFGHILGTKWGTVDTYGGKIIQNITEGVQSDIMANGAHNAEREGYQIATLIHDQALAYHQPGQTVERFVELLTDLPEWAAGLPIAAEGSICPFYRKE